MVLTTLSCYIWYIKMYNLIFLIKTFWFGCKRYIWLIDLNRFEIWIECDINEHWNCTRGLGYIYGSYIFSFVGCFMRVPCQSYIERFHSAMLLSPNIKRDRLCPVSKPQLIPPLTIFFYVSSFGTHKLETCQFPAPNPRVTPPTHQEDHLWNKMLVALLNTQHNNEYIMHDSLFPDAQLKSCLQQSVTKMIYDWGMGI